MAQKPQVLIVDDQPDSVARLLASVEGQLDVVILDPPDVTTNDVRESDLVLVDHFLDLWLERYKGAPSVRPKHGIALAGALQSYVDGLAETIGTTSRGTPTAFALISAELARVGGRLPDDMREHAIARLHNLEWAFDKSDRQALGPQVLALAEMVRAVPRALQGGEADGGRQALDELLRVPAKEVWADRARADIFRCHPPIFELAQVSKGLAVVRWLLHRIIPYPTFLIDDFELAARLRVRRSAVDVLARDGFIERVRYQGALDGFLGRRWWRSGVEQAIWEITDGRRWSLGRAVQERAPRKLEPLDLINPVVVLDAKYRPSDIIAAEDAVRVQPDDWPSYADSAWMDIDQVRGQPDLAALVLDADRERIEDPS